MIKIPSLFLAGVLAMGTALPNAQAQAPAAASRLEWRGEHKDVEVADLRSQRRGDMLVVQAQLHNRGEQNQTVYWRYRWLDEAGLQVGDPAAWQPLLVLGQQTQFLRGSAPSAAASDFRLELNLDAGKATTVRR